MQRFLAIVGPLPFMALAIAVAGLALGVGVFVFDRFFSVPLSNLDSWLRYPLTGLALAASYFAYGLSLIVIAPALNFLLGGRLSPYRGSAVSASVMAHYAQGGYLVIAPVKIGAGATIGLRAVIMGGVEVGAKAKVLASSFVLPNTKILPGETWAGIPAQRIELERGGARAESVNVT